MFTPEVVRQPNTFTSSQFRSFAVKGPKGRKGRKGQKAAVASPFELRHRLAAISDVVREKVPAWCNDRSSASVTEIRRVCVRFDLCTGMISGNTGGGSVARVVCG
jgi:hypothetical protein